MAAGKDNVLSGLNCLVQNWENWKEKVFPSFCPPLGRFLRR